MTIELSLKDRFSAYKISKELGRSINTILEDWMKTLPRRILKYKTPEELFELHLDQIYSI